MSQLNPNLTPVILWNAPIIVNGGVVPMADSTPPTLSPYIVASAVGGIKITGLPYIEPGALLAIDWQVSVAEVVQVYDIGYFGNVPTILDDTTYSFSIQPATSNSTWTPYTYTTGTLTGTAQGSRKIVYDALAAAVNLNTNNYTTADVLHIIPFDNLAGGNFVAGDVIDIDTGGASAVVVAQVLVGVADGFLIVSTYVGAAEANNYDIDNVTTPAVSAIVDFTTDVVDYSLRLTDDAGYLPVTGVRGGENGVLAPINGNLSTFLSLTTAAVMPFGQGSDLLAGKPVVERTTDNLASGSWVYPQNETPISTDTYSAATITVKYTAANFPNDKAGKQSYRVWVNETIGAQYTSAVAAFNGATGLKSLI